MYKRQYQIFVDRFYNGDRTNDVETGEYAYIGEHSVRVEDWSKYPAFMGVREFYGGDLKGVLEKIDYLQELGVEAVYFNPLFVSPSNHKYEIQDYDFIDPHYGCLLYTSKMRLDKFLKVSRLIKRRTVANEACDAGRVLVNGTVAKASVKVKPGDVIEIQFGTKTVKVEVLAIQDTTKKEEAKDLFRYL